jgi:hypothetical protein
MTHTSSRSVKALVAIAVAALLISACGGSGDEGPGRGERSDPVVEPAADPERFEPEVEPAPEGEPFDPFESS